MSAVIEQPPHTIEVDALNAMFEKEPPANIVKWATAEFGDELVMTSSFGAQAAVLIHLAIQARPDIRIIFIDTGYLFPETHQFMEDLRRRFNLNVWTYRTRNDPFAYLHAAGEDNHTFRKDIDACCAANKIEPMERAMHELKPRAWLRGIRRPQGSDLRAAARFIEWSPRYGCYAVSPMLNWTRKEIGLYMKEHNLPYHPLVDKGYPSIGCNPLSCTQPVQLGTNVDDRTGRWAGKNKLECGINSLDSAGL